VLLREAPVSDALPSEAAVDDGAGLAVELSVYDDAELDATASSIEQVQLSNGMIPWYAGGHGDPWNHVEAAMALSATGRWHAAERAYAWLAACQRDDGAWHAAYASDGSVGQERLDTNLTTYVAAGVRHHYLASGDSGFLEQMWPVVERAVDWVLGLQRADGALTWALEANGRPGEFALLAASSSACTSLRGALGCAGALGLERPRWAAALDRLADALASRPWSFAPKPEYAMDWYYPVLAGAVVGRTAGRRIEAGWPTWVVAGHGVLCRSDRPWVTTAETAECAIACALLGRTAKATALLAWTRAHRRADGSYATGTVLPGGGEFPVGERSTYSAAAVVLAADLLAGSLATSAVFSA
jgi:hypothetical protein